MNDMVVLIIEDDTHIKRLISTTLIASGYKVLLAKDGKEAILEATTHNPDIILLDLGLPDIDGIEIIEKIRSWTETPIIVISARSDDKDKIEALDKGADDYLTKPFSVEEMLARIRVAQRRLTNVKMANPSNFINGSLEINYASGCVYVNQKELHLTPIEYKLICLLAKNVGKVLTHTYITNAIWGTSWESDVASLRVFMATLRKKIEGNIDDPQIIQTHVGIGYRMLML